MATQMRHSILCSRRNTHKLRKRQCRTMLQEPLPTRRRRSFFSPIQLYTFHIHSKLMLWTLLFPFTFTHSLSLSLSLMRIHIPIPIHIHIRLHSLMFTCMLLLLLLLLPLKVLFSLSVSLTVTALRVFLLPMCVTQTQPCNSHAMQCN